MGGTSTDVSLSDGHPRISTEASIDGFPIRVPVLDIHTVGAGGGSLARVDEGGLLRVGPESAGVLPANLRARITPDRVLAAPALDVSGYLECLQRCRDRFPALRGALGIILVRWTNASAGVGRSDEIMRNTK